MNIELAAQRGFEIVYLLTSMASIFSSALFIIPARNSIQ